MTIIFSTTSGSQTHYYKALKSTTRRFNHPSNAKKRARRGHNQTHRFAKLSASQRKSETKKPVSMTTER